MNRIMCQEPDGRISYIAEGKPGELLTGDGWRKFDARTVPYTSATSGSIPDVSAALDYLFQRHSELTQSIAASLTVAQRAGADSEAFAATTRNAVAGLEARLVDAIGSAGKNQHASVALSKVSNPALRVNDLSQILWLDLTEPGSFDDSGAKLGVNTVQGAITRLAAMIGELRNDYYRAWNETVLLSQALVDVKNMTEANAKTQTDIERRLAALEGAKPPTGKSPRKRKQAPKPTA